MECKHEVTQVEHGLLWLERSAEEIRCLDCGVVVEIQEAPDSPTGESGDVDRHYQAQYAYACGYWD